MDYDTKIRLARNKCSSYDNSIENIKKAIEKYQETLEVLQPIKGIESCEELRKKINAKILELNDLISSINKKKNALKNDIREIQSKKEQEK